MALWPWRKPVVKNNSKKYFPKRLENDLRIRQLRRVVELDKRFGNKWRYNSKIRQRCSNRKRLIVAREEATRRGVPVEEIVSLMDGIKARDGHRLSFKTALGYSNDKRSLSSLL